MKTFATKRVLLLVVGLAAFVVSVPASAQTVSSVPRVNCFFTCSSPAGKTKPKQIVFSANGDLSITVSRWRSWGATSAYGAGTVSTRALGSGAFRRSAGSVTLSTPRSCRGRQYFTKARVSYAGKRRTLTLAACW